MSGVLAVGFAAVLFVLISKMSETSFEMIDSELNSTALKGVKMVLGHSHNDEMQDTPLVSFRRVFCSHLDHRSQSRDREHRSGCLAGGCDLGAASPRRGSVGWTRE